MSESTVPWAQRIVLYLVNSLTIFSVAFGLNSAGVQAFAQQQQVRGLETAEGFFRAWPLLQ